MKRLRKTHRIAVVLEDAVDDEDEEPEEDEVPQTPVSLLDPEEPLVLLRSYCRFGRPFCRCKSEPPNRETSNGGAYGGTETNVVEHDGYEIASPLYQEDGVLSQAPDSGVR